MLIILRCLIIGLLCSVHTACADDWHHLEVPEAWRSVPSGELAPVNGYSWYRVLFKVPAAWDGQQLTLFVEALDDARSAWVGGQAVGATGTFPPQFRSGLGERGRFAVAGDLGHGDQFVCVAIRVYQNDPRPNFSVAPPVLMNEARKEAVRLEGIWQYRPGDEAGWAQATAADFGIDASRPVDASEAAAKGVYLQAEPVDDVEKYVTRRKGDTDALTPEEALKHFQVPEDLRVELVLGDPIIAQPLFMTWDDRGRLWVMEYRQYPDPAGLKMLSRDTFLRSVYDKVPPPPPNHFRGADRISIHEDADGNGTYEKHSIFVDGLNIATSMAPGRGGVFVTNPPYLLFYPDHNQDDIPDGDPEVLLEGFGLEDSHSVINSLRFGPDGWLYGAQGSTVTGVVRRPGSTDPPVRSLGQVIWRYHPEKRIYEVFAEGGGNTFGCEIDEKGRVFSGHNGGDTRGFHYVQGGYYQKGFGKHGPLSNPYAFGYFGQMKHHSVARFTHTFVIYEDIVLPDRFRGQLFGVEPLQGQVVLSNFRPYQSSFETEDVERVLKTDDPWFRPVDIKTGPDGCIYVADLYEQRIDHSSHYAGRVDKTSGRIYRLNTRDGVRRSLTVALNQLDSKTLLEVLAIPSAWMRSTANRLLGDRADPDLSGVLETRLKDASGQLALEYLWALNLSGGLTDERALVLLSHQDPFVRAWTVRLMCDFGSPSDSVGNAIAKAAESEGYVDVRKQMASSARRIRPELALPILRALLKFDEDAADIHQPLLIWWAIETQIGKTNSDVLLRQLLSEPDTWQRPLFAQHVAERLMKRYALAGSRQDLIQAAALLRAAPDRASADRLLKGFEDAFQGRSLAGIPDEMAQALASSGGGSLALRFRQGQESAVTEALRIIGDQSASADQRRPLIEISGQLRRPDVLPALIHVVESEQDASILAAAIAALQWYDEPQLANIVLKRWNDLKEEPRLAAEAMLVSRASWSELLMTAAESNPGVKDGVSVSGLRRMLLHPDATLRGRVEALWGPVGGPTAAEVQAESARVGAALAAGTGNPRTGKQLYLQNCGRCHLLFEEGGRIGPDLTPFARQNVDRMLASVINPSLEIREGFENYLVVTTDGRVLNGFLADKDPQIVILRGVDGQNTVIRQDDIEEMKMIPQSVMPDGALKNFNDQQLRDLFAYLRSTQPVNY